MKEMDCIKSTLVPYTLSEDSMDEEEEVELSNHEEGEVEVKQEVDEVKGGKDKEHLEQSLVDETTGGQKLDKQLDCTVSRPESDPEEIEEKVQFMPEMAECANVQEKVLLGEKLAQVKSEESPIGDEIETLSRGRVREQELGIDGVEEEIAQDLQPPCTSPGVQATSECCPKQA